MQWLCLWRIHSVPCLMKWYILCNRRVPELRRIFTSLHQNSIQQFICRKKEDSTTEKKWSVNEIPNKFHKSIWKYCTNVEIIKTRNGFCKKPMKYRMKTRWKQQQKLKKRRRRQRKEGKRLLQSTDRRTERRLVLPTKIFFWWSSVVVWRNNPDLKRRLQQPDHEWKHVWYVFRFPTVIGVV